MEKIEKIIIITNLNVVDSYIVLDTINKTIYIDNNELEYKNCIIDNFLNIISTWNNYYEDISVLDGEYYKIDVISNLKTYSFTNNGAYPSNFISFKKWVEDLYDNF